MPPYPEDYDYTVQDLIGTTLSDNKHILLIHKLSSLNLQKIQINEGGNTDLS